MDEAINVRREFGFAVLMCKRGAVPYRARVIEWGFEGM